MKAISTAKACTIDEIRANFQDTKPFLVPEQQLLKIDAPTAYINIWASDDQDVDIELTTTNVAASINTLYIRSNNKVRLHLFSKQADLKIIKVIIETPGIILDTKLKFAHMQIFISGSKLQLPHYVAEKLHIEKIKDIYNEELKPRLTGVVIIPSCGEFVLDPTKANKAKTSVKELTATFPNLAWTSLVVSWFGTSLNIKDCKILPGIDRNAKNLSDWRVGKVNIHTEPYKVSLHPKNFSNFGGTPDDKSVIGYVNLLRDAEVKIAFYPFFQMDIPGKPWRGRLSGDAADVEEFFSKQYFPFILHYAKMLKGKIDAFIIGSELIGLTAIKKTSDSTDTKPAILELFPAVQQLINLAKFTKVILGKDVMVTYAADWSEYFTSDGVNRPLDELWACDAIDVVGIDAYFPLTEVSEYSRINRKAVEKGWSKGEGIDYYYDGDAKVPFSKEEPWNHWKDLYHWWSSEHWVEGAKTSWRPKMKKLWLTEVGFASIDRAPNQPNVFFDPECTEGGVPKHSIGAIDYAAQKVAALGTMDFLDKAEHIANYFFWCWDARGIGWHMERHKYYDWKNWRKGHWLDGKLEDTQPIYIGPTKQYDLSVKSFTDVDLIPSILVDKLDIDTEGSIKWRQDMIIPGVNLPTLLKYESLATAKQQFTKSLSKVPSGKYVWKLVKKIIELRSEALKEYNGKTVVKTKENNSLKYKAKLILVSLETGVLGGDISDIFKQFYSSEYIAGEDYEKNAMEVEAIGLSTAEKIE